MEAIKLRRVFVSEVCDIKLEVEEQNLKIAAIGMASTDGWEKPRLELRHLGKPADGIYDFDFYAQGPDHAVVPSLEKVIAIYNWENFPKDLRGVRVHADRNSILVMR